MRRGTPTTLGPGEKMTVNVLGNTVATKLVTRFGGRAAMDDELPATAEHAA